jgi:predicted Fe-S protein YdhL (DUF1289 family)
MSPMASETPCIAVCIIDPRTDLCMGCGRTLLEIAKWHAMDSPQRLAVMATLPQRMADAGMDILPALTARLEKQSRQS